MPSYRRATPDAEPALKHRTQRPCSASETNPNPAKSETRPSTPVDTVLAQAGSIDQEKK